MAKRHVSEALPYFLPDNAQRVEQERAEILDLGKIDHDRADCGVTNLIDEHTSLIDQIVSRKTPDCCAGNNHERVADPFRLEFAHRVHADSPESRRHSVRAGRTGAARKSKWHT